MAIEKSAESSVPQPSLSKRTGDLPTTRTRTGLSDEVRAHSMSNSIPDNSQAGDSFTREDPILSHGRTLSYWLSLSSCELKVRR